MLYLIYKLVHICSVVLFLGNILTGLYWAWHSHKSKDLRSIASTFDGIIHSDKFFTVPGVIGIVSAGIAAAIHNKIPILGTGWIFWSIILFTISGLIFGIFIAPLQRRLLTFVLNNNMNQDNWNIYSKLYKQWVLWGVMATITPITAIVLMVLKPALPGADFLF